VNLGEFVGFWSGSNQNISSNPRAYDVPLRFDGWPSNTQNSEKFGIDAWLTESMGSDENREVLI
jgi:hypothetical protein